MYNIGDYESEAPEAAVLMPGSRGTKIFHLKNNYYRDTEGIAVDTVR